MIVVRTIKHGGLMKSSGAARDLIFGLRLFLVFRDLCSNFFFYRFGFS